MISLHWLPIKARIEYKICLLTHKAVTYGVPKYLRDYLEPYEIESEIVTRIGNDKHRLKEPHLHLELGRRAFRCSAPRLYNGLPVKLKEAVSVESYKKSLKTTIFKKCYNLQRQEISEDYKVT